MLQQCRSSVLTGGPARVIWEGMRLCPNKTDGPRSFIPLSQLTLPSCRGYFKALGNGEPRPKPRCGERERALFTLLATGRLFVPPPHPVSKEKEGTPGPAEERVELHALLL